ncbi:MAG: hypothetical protein V8T87_00480 [Victivallales bacterium]
MPTARNITRTGTLIQAATRLRKKADGLYRVLAHGRNSLGTGVDDAGKFT